MEEAMEITGLYRDTYTSASIYFHYVKACVCKNCVFVIFFAFVILINIGFI